jgi:hypothetical protein
MHPEVHAAKRGSVSRVCGMPLEVGATTPLITNTEYVCPMHAQIVREAPGSCPICGMALEPRTVTAEETPNSSGYGSRVTASAHVGARHRCTEPSSAAVSPCWDWIGKLGVAAVIRTGLNFFFSMEIKGEWTVEKDTRR